VPATSLRSRSGIDSSPDGGEIVATLSFLRRAACPGFPLI